MKTNYKLQYQRRRSGSTNYRKRLKLLISRKPRLVVRRSLNNIRVQLEEYSPKGDVAKAFAVSSELKKAGWKYSTDSLPAAYLTGLLCGIRAKQAGVKEAILDLGLYRPINGSRLYAALKGAIDAEIKIPANPSSFPKDERLKGTHIANYAAKLKKESPDDYKKRFSGYAKHGASPENIVAAFEETREKIKRGELAKA